MKKSLILILIIIVIIFIIFIISKYSIDKDDNIINKYNDHTEYKFQVFQSAIYLDRFYYESNIEDEILSIKNYKKIGDNFSLIEERINECISEWNLEDEISQEEINLLLNENNYYYLNDMKLTETEHNFKLYIYNVDEKYILRIKNYS